MLNDSYKFRNSCEWRLITGYRSNLKLVLCTTCVRPLTCSGNGHVLRILLVILKYLREARLMFGSLCSQSLYRIIGQTLTETFLENFCQSVDAPSDCDRADVGDHFFKPMMSPPVATGLKDLSVFANLNIVFTGRDLFGMSYLEYLERKGPLG